MPIPTPRTNEKENEFISRCMSATSGDEGSTNQRLAICYDAWGEKTGASQVAVAPTDVHRVFSSPVRAVDDKDGLFKSYGAIWGDEDHMDWYGTWFTRESDLCLDWYQERPWLYGHGMNKFAGAQKLGTWKDHGIDDHGLFFLGELNERFEYLDEVEFLLEIGYLFPSSGTLSHIMRIADDGWIERWPVCELSSTPQPAEWRIPAQVGATASQRRKAAAAIRTLIGGMKMSEEVLARIMPGVDVPAAPEPTRADNADADVDVGTSADAPVDVAPGEPVVVEEGVDASADPGTDDVDDELIQTAIQSVDNALREAVGQIEELSARLETLEAAQSPVQVIRQAVDDPHWTTQLFAATRAGRALRGEDGEPLDQTASLLTQLGSVVGGEVDGGDVLTAIMNSQR